MCKQYTLNLVVTIFISFLLVTNAHAWFQFKNSTSSTVWVAFQWYSPNSCANDAQHDGGLWETKGWYSIAPGQTKIVFGSDLQSTGNRYYYWYAESSNGSVWSGAYNTYVPSTAFDWCLNTGSTNSRIVGFREKYIGTSNNYTVNLTP
ncbi:hypothetical protein W03_13650 [Nitrosomonas sp. PY1]|uniref:DUF1036 domain-containing protein n=1 Tax=Nitrosomonas sp. PY1 TaxID=1803906 RepID=UPI001FC7EE54|nr:DUF1036 domain-containing protein [Nitrosomonas sp. PY1]GKS69361.1 hypothetical protein W03_13650 [Nitrosomonas sp. PY1]